MADGSAGDTAISTTSGAYSLQGGARSAREGTYDYDPATGTIYDEMRQQVGRFTRDPICAFESPSPFAPGFLDTNADKPLPHIRVIKGEVMEDIQNPDNEGAYFVLPSQLNGAEYPSHRNPVLIIEDYKHDRTGGPRGQLAVHPAAGQFVLDNAACDGRETGISAVDGILSALQEKPGKCASGFALCNGYLQMPMPRTQEDADETFQAFTEKLDTSRPLIMRDVIACGLLPNMNGFSEANHRVGLVYASAVPVNAYMNSAGRHGPAADLHHKVAEAVLVSQYYGALSQLADTRGGRTTVYLMPLGGGVFNNSWESIAKSMALAVELLSEDKLAGLDIRVLTWRGKPEEYTTMTTLLGRLNKLAT